MLKFRFSVQVVELLEDFKTGNERDQISQVERSLWACVRDGEVQDGVGATDLRPRTSGKPSLMWKKD